MQHPALPKVTAGLSIVILAGVYLVWASMTGHWPYSPASGVSYRNEQFGFSVDLPESWQGFRVQNQKEDIYDITGATTTNNGVIGNFTIFSIQHPLSTLAHPRQDIPIMVFTKDQWECVRAEKCSVGAAPIPPSERARNSRYVFALPARYNYAFPEGWQEVEQILADNPVHAFEPNY